MREGDPEGMPKFSEGDSELEAIGVQCRTGSNRFVEVESQFRIPFHRDSQPELPQTALAFEIAVQSIVLAALPSAFDSL